MLHFCIKFYPQSYGVWKSNNQLTFQSNSWCHLSQAQKFAPFCFSLTTAMPASNGANASTSNGANASNHQLYRDYVQTLTALGNDEKDENCAICTFRLDEARYISFKISNLFRISLMTENKQIRWYSIAIFCLSLRVRTTNYVFVQLKPIFCFFSMFEDDSDDQNMAQKKWSKLVNVPLKRFLLKKKLINS